MENQNSTEQTKKGFNLPPAPSPKGEGSPLHGKKKWIIIICIAFFLLGSCAARGLGLRGSLGMGWGNIIGNTTGISAVAARDFESLGIVFAETTASRRNGYGTTHDALIREALAKGADAIINVNIAPTSGVFNRTWTGSALAIKYQN